MYIIASEHGHYARFSCTDALYKTENREEASVFPNRDSAIYTLKKCVFRQVFFPKIGKKNSQS